MEGSNYWGYGYKTQHSYPRSRLITWRSPEVKFGRNVVRKTTKKLPRWGQKVRNKKKKNSQGIVTITWSRLTQLEQFTPMDQKKEFSSIFCVKSDMKHLKNGRRTYQPKRYEYHNKYKFNCPNILSYNNYQALSQKFRQKIFRLFD